MFDLNQPGMLQSQLITLTGDGEIANRDRPGFAYDPVSDKYVAYSGVEGGGPRDIYIIDPDSWTSTRTESPARCTSASTNRSTPNFWAAIWGSRG